MGILGRRYRGGGPRPDRKEQKQQEALDRAYEYSLLSPEEKKAKSDDWKKK